MSENTFRTKRVYFKEEQINVVTYRDLIKLLKDTNCEYIDDLKDRFNIEDEDLPISITNVGNAYKAVYKKVMEYEYYRLPIVNSKISTHIIDHEENQGKSDFVFKFKTHRIEAIKEDVINAISIYNSKDQFYEKVKLSNHVNFLLKNRLDSKLQELNSLWINNSLFPNNRVYKLLKNKNNRWFIRSITSKDYKEYGTAFTFVYTILLLNEYESFNKGYEFKIEALDLSESKISMAISQGKSKKLKDIGYITSSLEMVNNDLRTGSFIIKQKITLRSLSNSNNSFTIQPIRKDIKNNEVNIPHNRDISTLNKNFKHFFDELTTLENFEEDYLNILKNKKAKSLYKVIEGKILRSKILKDCKELKNLFGKKSTQEIDNLAKLIDLCGKADQLDIDYDLKSKLREIISDVLFKTNN